MDGTAADVEDWGVLVTIAYGVAETTGGVTVEAGMERK
jgi:hypothetical protein